VMTKSGEARPIKWIGRRSYGGRLTLGRKDILPVCIKAGALADNVPKRDLWISPNHAMYLDSVLIEARDLINGASIVQAERVETVQYIHIELDSHDVIIAEGALAESFIDDDGRGLFHNAHEYRALYPDATNEVLQYCAPRLRDGYELEAARRRIALRAGLQAPDQQARVGSLRGFVDLISPGRIAGWAQSTDHPGAPVCLDIYVDGELIAQTLANRYRSDLKRAGIGDGRHSFEFKPPAGLVIAAEVVEVRRSLDGAVLQRSACARAAA
jgi:Hint domain